MKVLVDRRDALAAVVDVAASPVAERTGKDDPFPRSLAKEDEVTKGLVRGSWEKKEIRGKRGELTTFHRPDGRGRVVLVGVGPRDRLDAESVRRAAAVVVKGLKGRGARTLAFRVPSFLGEAVTSEAVVRALVDGAVLGGYEFVKYKTQTEGGVEEVTLALGEELGREEAGTKKVVAEEHDLAETVVWTREIANLPADTATPERLAEEARALGKELGLKVTVFDEKKLTEMRCGGLLAVGIQNVDLHIAVAEDVGRAQDARADSGAAPLSDRVW